MDRSSLPDRESEIFFPTNFCIENVRYWRYNTNTKTNEQYSPRDAGPERNIVMTEYILSIDQGTTLTQAVLYDRDMTVRAVASQSVAPVYTPPDRSEQDPEAIWQAVSAVCQQAMQMQGITATDLNGLSITNQRETTLIWDRRTGKPLYPAIGWQDRRTEPLCEQWREEGREVLIQGKTGLILDPYFSGTKVHWLLQQVEGARGLADQGNLCFGTIDSFLLWRLTDGQVHATDATNASRTLLFNIHEQCWDDELLTLMDIPHSVLPEVRDSSADFGHCSANFLGAAVPISAVIGDQQAALVGQNGFTVGAAKATYGSGCFALVNTGDRPVQSQNRLITTLAYRLQGKPTYAVEGSIFMAGSVINWLRDGLNVIQDTQNVEAMAQGVPLDQPEVMVPAFTGLGAPHWDNQARGAIFGLTRSTQANHLVAAALRSVAYQTEDLFKAMRYDGISVQTLKVDGGLLTNRWFLQTLADVTDVRVLTCPDSYAASRGAALLAALQLGWQHSLTDLSAFVETGDTYEATISDTTRDTVLRRWDEALLRIQAPLS